MFRIFSKSKNEKGGGDGSYGNMTFDLSEYTPVIRASICTGEKTAGFQEKANGRFHDVMLIRNDADMEEFRRKYGIDGEIKKIY